MKHAIRLLSVLSAVLVGILTSPSPAAAITGPGSYGCATDTIAATKINGVTYTATEKTCVEILPNLSARTHGVTRCYRSGAPFNCLIINGDTVEAILWVDGAITAGTRQDDRDCSNCLENSHYSTTVPCLAGSRETFLGDEANLRVAWAPGVISAPHGHSSNPVTLDC